MRRCLGLLVVLLVLVPSSAFAHSNLVETDPADGATLTTLPPEATVTFNEELQNADAALVGPGGKVDKLTTRLAGSTVKIHLPPDGPRGKYTLSYRVVSADGHPVSGSTTFAVTAGPTPTATATQAPAPPATDEPAGRPLAPIVIGVAILGVAATVFAARSMRR